ncbi:hypothetical protein DY000_02042412 [Brassica cretica]|uniref:Endonuclease/exonuclease/phosphatase domain-containing protein n=1 Tax=Brassica cretica TaxID=69181 RepID=A0ABQ7BKM0_BRACR|nr:hypothetical protein DY000_02042412 [Brassica cretica]
MAKLCNGWKFTSNHASDDDGRIFLIWKPSVSVQVLHQSRQSLTCEVKIPGSSVFIYTAIYAANTRSERTDLWVDLINVQQTLALHSAPWMVGGDFNQILHPAEHYVQSLNSPSTMLFEQEKELLQKWQFLRSIEESYFKQRSRIMETVLNGDLNSFYTVKLSTQNSWNDHWILPHPRSEKQLQLHAFLTTIEFITGEDYYEWELEGNIHTTFSTGQVYAILSGHGAAFPWAHIVWIVGVGDFKPHQLACSVTRPQSRVIISTFSALIHGACGTLLLVDAAWIHNNNGMMSQLNFNHTIVITGEEYIFCLPGKVASLGLGRKGTVAFIVILSDPLMG